MTQHTDHSDRVENLIAQMTLEEKIAQLYGVWVGASDEGGDVAPHQHDLDDAVDLDALLPHGLGQLTRPFGTKPVDAALGALSLARTQERLRAASRFGIPAIAHEECLAGFAAWGATAYPVPLSWGATFDPDLVAQLGRRIGDDLRSVGVHQGLAPVLDVVRDARWGRVEETIGEDPHLVATIGAAYVSGVESAGVVATLKHFAGYSASKGGRNLAPVSIGPRELADVILPPFELAVRETGVRSVMNSYTDLDGVPTAADRSLLTGLLRETWGFEGTVVADYFSVAFLKLLHGVADTWADAAGQALAAGVDVELPTVKTFGEPLRRAVEEGIVDAALVDQSLRRVLRQKEQLGLLDPDWSVIPPALAGVDLSDPEALRGAIDLDPRENRALAARLAEEAIVLVRNDGTLPLARDVRRRIAVIGPNADDPYALLGCYSFPTHVVSQHPGVALGIRIPTLLEALREEYPDADIEHVRGTSVDGGELDGIAEAVALAATADVVILALGDRAGLFGRGTSGEGCDAESLALPGAQQHLVDAVLDAGIPAVVVMLAGRPYALGRAVQEAAGIVEAFFAGEEGGAAIAGVLSGRVEPSGRLPVSIPRTSGSQPTTYLAAPLARATDVSNIDPSPAYPFGHGLSYAAFEWSDLVSETDEASTDGAFSLALRIANTGARDGVEVVQLYLHDPVAEVPRPVQRLIGYARVALAAGEAADVRFRVPADLASYTGRALARIVEPGALVLSAGRSSGGLVSSVEVSLTGSVRVVDHTRALVPMVEVALAARVVS